MGSEKSKRTTFILINVGSIKDDLKWTYDMMSCLTQVHVVCAWVLDLYYGVHGFDSFTGGEDFIKRSRSTLREEVDHYIEPTEFEIQEMVNIWVSGEACWKFCFIQGNDYISTLGEALAL
ncbi:hypothetical protein Tco_1168435 [Tanacetum coccineum]